MKTWREYINMKTESHDTAFCTGCYKEFPLDDLVGIQTSHDNINQYCKNCAPKREQELKTAGRPYAVKPNTATPHDDEDEGPNYQQLWATPHDDDE